MAQETPPELHKPLEDIRKEVIEARNMTIKTDNAIKTLHAELKVVAQQQGDFQKNSRATSAAAYVGFVVLAILAAVGLSQSRAGAANAEVARLEALLQEARAGADKDRASLSLAQEREVQAQELYRQVAQGSVEERLQGLDVYAKADLSRLSPFGRQVLEDRVAQLKREVGSSLLERARAAAKKGDWAEVKAQGARVAAMSLSFEEAAEAEFFLGQAAYQQKAFDEAVGHLQKFADADKKARGRDFALFMLMGAHDVLGHREKAAELAKEGLTLHPQSEFRGAFLSRLQPRLRAPDAGP